MTFIILILNNEEYIQPITKNITNLAYITNNESNRSKETLCKNESKCEKSRNHPYSKRCINSEST